MIEILSWVANIFLFSGLVLIGRKKKIGFIFNVLGEACYMLTGMFAGIVGLAVASGVFIIPNIIGYIRWAKDNKNKKQGDGSVS